MSRRLQAAGSVSLAVWHAIKTQKGDSNGRKFKLVFAHENAPFFSLVQESPAAVCLLVPRLGSLIVHFHTPSTVYDKNLPYIKTAVLNCFQLTYAAKFGVEILEYKQRPNP